MFSMKKKRSLDISREKFDCENAVKMPCFSQVRSAVKIIIGKPSTLGIPAIQKISVCSISMPQMASLIGCMDIIYAHL